MFGIGMTEMVVILGVALLVFGPQKLPEIAKQISKVVRDLRAASDDLRTQVSLAIDDPPTPRLARALAKDAAAPAVKPSAGIPDAASEVPPHITGSEATAALTVVAAAGSLSRDTTEHEAAAPFVGDAAPPGNDHG